MGNCGSKPKKMEDGGRVERLRKNRAANIVGRKMDKDNLPHSKSMQAKKKKSKGLMNSLLKMEYGGEVTGMKYGGKVGGCRGGGAAVAGTKFTGCK